MKELSNKNITIIKKSRRQFILLKVYSLIYYLFLDQYILLQKMQSTDIISEE